MSIAPLLPLNIALFGDYFRAIRNSQFFEKVLECRIFFFAKHLVVFVQKQKWCFWLGREPGLQILGRHIDVIGFAMRKLIFPSRCVEKKSFILNKLNKF